MSAGSSMLAMTLSFPPQHRHVSISIANTRLSRGAVATLDQSDNGVAETGEACSRKSNVVPGSPLM
jgi:hypothetical protein